jgi:hypothetical protein
MDGRYMIGSISTLSSTYAPSPNTATQAKDHVMNVYVIKRRYYNHSEGRHLYQADTDYGIFATVEGAQKAVDVLEAPLRRLHARQEEANREYHLRVREEEKVAWDALVAAGLRKGKMYEPKDGTKEYVPTFIVSDAIEVTGSAPASEDRVASDIRPKPDAYVEHEYWDNGHGQAKHSPWCPCV